MRFTLTALLRLSLLFHGVLAGQVSQMNRKGEGWHIG